MKSGSLMKEESIAECSLGAFCNTFDLHLAIIVLENQFLVPLKTGFTYYFTVHLSANLTLQGVNNKDDDQTAWVCRLVCAL